MTGLLIAIVGLQSLVVVYLIHSYEDKIVKLNKEISNLKPIQYEHSGWDNGN